MEHLSKRRVKRMIKGLNEAKRILKSKDETYICLALERVFIVDCSFDDLEYLTDWLENMLGEDEHGNKISLVQWLLDAHTIDVKSYSVRTYERTILATRIKWINWMIKHLKETT